MEGGGPPAIRDSHENLMGLPGVRVCDQRKLDLANKQADQALEYLHEAFRRGIPGYIENPQTSRLWLLPALQSLVRDRRAWYANLHMCQYGTPWEKATKLLTWGVPDLSFKFLCRGGAGPGTCSRTLEKHDRLRALSSDGRFNTRQAQVYPPQFAQALCDSFELFLL